MLPSSSTDQVKSSSHQGSSVLRRPNVLILLILALALGLRLYKSSVHGLYLDEKFTLVNTAGVRLEGANQHDVFDKPGNPYFTPKEFWKPKLLRDYVDSIIQNDIGNSPSHYALLWAWVQLFGLSDLSIRMPSILFSTAIVGLLFLLVRRYLKSSSLALTVAGLAAVEPFFIAYSHMARNYCMTIFMALLGTWFFLRILDRRAQGQQPIGLYVGYGLSFALATLGHYLAATIFMGHALYLLVFNRNFKTYLGLGLSTAGGALALIVPWFVWGGGKYTLFTLAYQAKLYGGLALTNPYTNGFGIILPATLANVIKKSIPVWSDLFMISNGLSPETLGNLNLLVALALGVVALALVLRFGQGVVVPAWLKIAVPLVLVAGYVVYSLPTARFVVAAALPMMGFCLYQAIARTATDERRFLVLMGLLSFFPTLVLIAFAFRNGHTYGITQRYSGFSFPYALVLMGMLVQQVFRQPAWLRTVLGVVLLIQAYFIGDLLYRVYEDQAPKYTYYGRYRIENPYNAAAQRIIKLYTPGDTVLYPSARTAPRDAIEETFRRHSIIDAQYTNLYLPKDATYYQRMDTTQTERIMLIKPTGKRITIYNFEGTKYRY